MRGVLIKDIIIPKSYIDSYMDYRRVPAIVRKKADKFMDTVSRTGTIPSGCQTHQSTTGVWIAYLTVKHGAWRLLFEYDEINNTIILLDIIKHEEMNIYLRRTT